MYISKDWMYTGWIDAIAKIQKPDAPCFAIRKNMFHYRWCSGMPHLWGLIIHLQSLQGADRICSAGRVDCTKVLGGISQYPLFIQHSEIELKRILKNRISSEETDTYYRNTNHFTCWAVNREPFLWQHCVSKCCTCVNHRRLGKMEGSTKYDSNPGHLS